MRHLSIADYNDRERDARITASYPALRAFVPVAFEHVRFPSRVTDERELIRYADALHETCSRSEFLERRTFSETEASAILQLVDQVKSVTDRHFGRPVQPLMCLFHPIPLLRAVEAIARARQRRLRIFEIGPGSGYLGAYLVNAGHSYAAVDVSQALYLWQNRLFAGIAGDGSEWALDAGLQTRCMHIPWWHYSRFHEDLPIAADLVICDAALGELDEFGFHYSLRIAARIVQASDCAALLFQEVGEPHVRSRGEAEVEVRNAGFSDHLAVGEVSIFAMPGRLQDVFASQAPALAYLGSAGERHDTPGSFLRFKEEDLLESYRFFRFLGWGL